MTPGVTQVSRRRLPLLLVALAIAAALVLTDGRKDPEVVPATTRSPAVSALPGATVASLSDVRPELPAVPTMVSALKPRTTGSRIEDIFVSRSWRKPAPVQAVALVAPVTPEAPALPYTFLGKQFLEGRWQVFMGLRERTLIVKENDTVDGVWRVSAIKPPSMGILHLPTGQPRVLAIGEGD